MKKARRRARDRRLHIVITAGPTREYFDSVRYISNGSSGKMGYALAEAARDAGHRVTLISGPVSLSLPTGVSIKHVVSAAEMLAATRQAFRQADAVIFAAAVSDYRPTRRAALKSAKSKTSTTIRLAPTADIAASLGEIKGRRVTIGFALEDHSKRAHAERKFRLKRLDGIVLNDLGTVEADDAVVEFFDGREWEKWPRMSKRVTAGRIMRRLMKLVEDCWPPAA